MKVLILGGNSEIGVAIAAAFARHARAEILLASRDIAALGTKAAQLTQDYQVKAQALPFDAADFATHASFYAGIEPKPDVVIFACGEMPAESSLDFAGIKRMVDSNYLGAMSILNIVAHDFKARKQGVIVGIGSVAGVRGRSGICVYSSTKAGLNAYLSGLRSSLVKDNVHVLTVLPGYVKTKLLNHISVSNWMMASPATVGEQIYRAISKRKNILYTPRIWRWIMLIVRMVPEFIFKRLSL